MQNRELKFRGWDADLKLMLLPVDLSAPLQHYKWLGRHDVLIMQFTGLLDKNGKEIYEGDIVLAPDDGKYKVCCDVWLCMGIMPLMGRGFVSFTELAGRGNGLDFEIVGNIYESDLSTTK